LKFLLAYLKINLILALKESVMNLSQIKRCLGEGDRKSALPDTKKIAELPKDEPLVCSAFLFDVKGK
jgi:hypothetical protein